MKANLRNDVGKGEEFICKNVVGKYCLGTEVSRVNILDWLNREGLHSARWGSFGYMLKWGWRCLKRGCESARML